MTINNKTILVLAIAAAFVAGTITTGTIVNAQVVNDVVTACVDAKGKVRIVDDVKECNVDKETGYIWNADNDPTNELQNWSNLPGIPVDIADGDDQRSEAEVDAFVADNGFSVGPHTSPGIIDTYLEIVNFNCFPNAECQAFAHCTSGDLVTGGGAKVPFSQSLAINEPSDEDTWTGGFFNSESVDVTLTVTAVCADITP